MLMHITGEVTLGNIFIIITLVSMAIGMGIRLGSITAIINQHTADLIKHSLRLDTYEMRLVEIVADVQRLIGRVEATQDRLERAHGPFGKL